MPQREEEGRSPVKLYEVRTNAQFSLYLFGKLIKLFGGVQVEKTCAHVKTYNGALKSVMFLQQKNTHFYGGALPKAARATNLESILDKE